MTCLLSMYVGDGFSPYSLLFGGGRGTERVLKWRGGSGREKEGKEGNSIVWGVDRIVGVYSMEGREGEEKRNNRVHDGLILSLLPPFLSSQRNLSNTHTIPLSFTHHPYSLFHCSLHSPTHGIPSHIPLTTRSHYTTDDAL